MRICAKITLNAEIGVARDGLASLAGGGWLMSLPRQRDTYRGHPAGSGRPGSVVPGGADGLVAVVFGTLLLPTGPAVTLPVRWEPLEAGDEGAIFLDGDITLAPLPGPAGSILTLGGTGRIIPAVLTEDGYKQARRQVIETARAFITSTALILTGSAKPGRESPGPALSWLTGPDNGAGG